MAYPHIYISSNTRSHVYVCTSILHTENRERVTCSYINAAYPYIRLSCKLELQLTATFATVQHVTALVGVREFTFHISIFCLSLVLSLLLEQQCRSLSCVGQLRILVPCKNLPSRNRLSRWLVKSTAARKPKSITIGLEVRSLIGHRNQRVSSFRPEDPRSENSVVLNVSKRLMEFVSDRN